jgi:hypothetical protein
MQKPFVFAALVILASSSTLISADTKTQTVALWDDRNVVWSQLTQELRSSSPETFSPYDWHRVYSDFSSELSSLQREGADIALVQAINDEVAIVRSVRNSGDS